MGKYGTLLISENADRTVIKERWAAFKAFTKATDLFDYTGQFAHPQWLIGVYSMVISKALD